MRVVETRTVEAVARATADLASAEVSSAARRASPPARSPTASSRFSGTSTLPRSSSERRSEFHSGELPSFTLIEKSCTAASVSAEENSTAASGFFGCGLAHWATYSRAGSQTAGAA